MKKKDAVTHTCFTCKTKMPAAEALQFKDTHWYCKDCFAERVDREWFAQKVCAVFNIKSPGPRIYAERKRLREKCGYTDRTIVETLLYAVEEKRIKPMSESLYLVTPDMVDEMVAWRKKQGITEAAIERIERHAKKEPQTVQLIYFDETANPVRIPERVTSTWEDFAEADTYE